MTTVDLAANPLNPKREEVIQKQSIVSERLESEKSIEKVITNMNNQMKIVDEREDKNDEKLDEKEVENDDKFEDCFTESNR